MGFTAANMCPYCDRGEQLWKAVVDVCPLPHSHVYLFRNQFYKGRCVIAYEHHRREFFDLNASELSEFMNDVSYLASVLTKLYGADKINYAIFGDHVDHLHFHVVPKVSGEPGWGKPYNNNPDAKITLTEEAYLERAAELRERLLAGSVATN